MTVDEFLTWAEGRPGRYELFRGEVVAMSPKTVGHTKVKGAVYSALLAGVRQRGLPCHVLTDGATVRIDDTTAYEPDSLVYCGRELPSTALEVPEPVTRGRRITDAWFAALAIEWGCEWITLDRDFARFPGLKWQLPQ